MYDNLLVIIFFSLFFLNLFFLGFVSMFLYLFLYQLYTDLILTVQFCV